jgi:phosphomannomutase
MSKIKFGTDGWRAIIAQDFTFDNVRLVTQALLNYLKDTKAIKEGIAVGYDNRFQSENFARAAAEVCSGAGINTLLANHSVPTPVLSYSVKNLGLGAGIMITASHNPPIWNGFKIKESFGGSSFPATTLAVESRLEDQLRIPPSTGKIKLFDPDPPYLAKIKSLVNLEHILTHNLKIVVDAMHGSGAGYFQKLGVGVIEIRGWRDALFGGVNPEPLPVNLEESFSFVRETALKYSNELTACIVLDGDGDRLAAIDGSGSFINTHNVFCLLLRHLAVHRKLSGEVVKTFNLSKLIDKLCQKFGFPLTVTPIGFKHIAKLFLERDILMGGEESGGMAVKGFIPERDGVLAGLMLLELMAYEKKTLGQILEEIMREHGFFYYHRVDLSTAKAQEIVRQWSQQPPKEFGALKVSKIETLDGLKLNFEDDGWVLLRASGTEPLLRVYIEARSQDKLKQLTAAVKSIGAEN